MADEGIDLSLDDGFITVRLPGGKETSIDLWKVNDELAELFERTKGETSGARYEGILDIMERAGLPRGSHRMASQFLRQMTGAMQALEKKTSEGRESGGSTPASTP